MHAPRTLPILHAVTDDVVVSHPDFAARARAVMAAGRGRVALHLRAPGMNTRSLFILAEVLAEAQRTTGAWLVVNDRVDVALTAGARGAQLPARGLPVRDARALTASFGGSGLALGVSVHSLEAGRAAAEAGADWLVAGHVFTTASHDGVAPRGTEFVRDVVALAATVPVLAIGGIRPRHVPALRAAGASGIAIVRGLWESDDVTATVGEYLSAHDDHDGPRPADHGQR